jgi:hypothetical protein
MPVPLAVPVVSRFASEKPERFQGKALVFAGPGLLPAGPQPEAQAASAQPEALLVQVEPRDTFNLKLTLVKFYFIHCSIVPRRFTCNTEAHKALRRPFM